MKNRGVYRNISSSMAYALCQQQWQRISVANIVTKWQRRKQRNVAALAAAAAAAVAASAWHHQTRKQT